MSGEVQRRRNLKIDIEKVKDHVVPVTKTVNIILHDFNNQEPQEPHIYVKDGVRFVTHYKPITAEYLEEYEANIAAKIKPETLEEYEARIEAKEK